MLHEPFYLTAAVLVLATVVGLVAHKLRQPLIVAFIAAGLLVGPSALNWVEDTEPLELLAEIGIAVLLFLVGLKLDLKLVRATGLVALVTGLGQVAFTSGIGFVIALLLGMDVTTAIYVAVALTFSSTIIIVKLLSDKRELEELHGKIALGFLIVQDIVVVLVMITITAVGSGGDGSVPEEVAEVLGKGVAFLLVLAAVMRWVLPRVVHVVARSQELLLVAAIAWAVGVAATGDSLGFSLEIGAFLAGFALASTPYREAISARLTPLRDFLLLFFFIELGSQLDLGIIGEQVPQAVVLSAFVLIGNPLIVLVIMGFMRYRRRVAFLAGLTVAQISEFSLILITLAREQGHVGDETVGLVTLVGIITIGLSTYLIMYSGPIFERLDPYLAIFERKGEKKEAEREAPEAVDVIVFGMGRYGSHLVDRLLEEGVGVLVVDWDPYAQHDDERLSVIYGDAEDTEFPGSLPLDRAQWVVSTIPRVDTNRHLATGLERWGYQGSLALMAHTAHDVERLSDLGATVVLEPFREAAERGVERLLADLQATDSV
jgi:Kef-type K+ transport system membrane component KefB